MSTFSTDTPYLLTLSCDADKALTEPYLAALSEAYRSCHFVFPMENPNSADMLTLTEHAAVAVLFATAHIANEGLLRAVMTHLLSSDVPLLVCHLDEVPLPSGMQFQLALCPEFYPNRHPSLDSAVKTLADAPYIQNAMQNSTD